MVNDTQEAESRKYSTQRVQLLRLQNGKWAIYNAAFKLVDILEPDTLFLIAVRYDDITKACDLAVAGTYSASAADAEEALSELGL